MPQRHPEDFTRGTANCLSTEGRAITPPRGLMPQVPLYIPVPIQHFVSVLYFVCIGKKHCQQPGYSQDGECLRGKQSWYTPDLLKATFSKYK